MILVELDRFLTSVALKADAFGSRHSWRLSRWLREGTTTVHQALWSVSRCLGLAAVHPDLVEAARAAPPKAIPRYPVLSSEQISARAEKMLEGVCILDNGATVELDTLSWRYDPFDNIPSSARFRFHAFRWVWELIEAYSLTGHPGYLELAKVLVGRWMAECLYTERIEGVWDDHSTALRAIVLCQLWGACFPSEPRGSRFMQDLLAAIIRHARKLSQETFYRSKHNHGVTQAHALLAIGLLFPAHSEAQRWIELGRVRLEAHMAQDVSSEGMHREHSPSYHFAVFQQFYDAYRLATAYRVKFSLHFAERLQAMLTCGAYLLKPDGTLPALGDTWKTSSFLFRKQDLQEWPVEATREFLYSNTRGTEGGPPAEASVLLPNAGYAFFRSGWGTSEKFVDERFLAFRLSTFKTAHIHKDAFSFELYAYGDDLIVDSGGPFGYEQSMRNFLVSTAAHNTVIVDNRDQEVGEAQILQWRTSAQCDLLDVERHHYLDVIHRRIIAFIRPDYFLILDWLRAEQRHRYSQCFHLHPALEVSIEDCAIVTDNPSGGATVQIVPLLEDDLGIRLHQGVFNPAQGWVCLGHLRLVPNAVIDYQREGTSVAFAVLIVPQRPGGSMQVWKQIKGSLFQEETVIQVMVGQRENEIIVSPTGHLTVKG